MNCDLLAEKKGAEALWTAMIFCQSLIAKPNEDFTKCDECITRANECITRTKRIGKNNGVAVTGCRHGTGCDGARGLCTKNTSWALIERPYSCARQAVEAVYDRPGFFVQSRARGAL